MRAGATYVVLSLLAILLLPYAESIVNLPQWSMNGLLGILITGFPVSIYLAWNYERSPEGFVKTTSQQSWQNPYSTAGRKPLTGNLIIVGLVLLIVIVYLFPRSASNVQTPDPVESTLEPTVTDKSIAVIPFVNMSNDPDQEYFSDGMMEEILNHLVKIRDLQVVSRTSVMRYKGTTKSSSEIARELGVTSILEGSVRKAGNRIRITVQLIDGSTDMHLWSETYDRQLDDVFAIQSEVAQQVASTLQAEIQPEVRVRIEAQPTRSTEAYNLYLQATFQWRLVTEVGNQKAMELLEKIIQIDPGFADAYAFLGQMKSNFGWAGQARGSNSPEEAFIIGKPYFEKALEIDPSNEGALLFSAFNHLWYRWDFQAAEKYYQTLVELNPNYSWADFLIATGRFKEAVQRAEIAMEINPLSPAPWTEMILSYNFNDQHEEALKTIETAQKANFRAANLYVAAGRVYLYLEKYERVIETLEQFLKDYDHIHSPRPLGTLAIAYYHVGELDRFKELLQEIKAQSEDSSRGSPSFYLAMIYAQMGEIDTAFEWLDKAYQDHEVEMYWLKVEPPFEPLRSDPRWQEMLDKVGFPE